MYSGCYQYLLLAALVTVAQAMIMVKARDGSIAPWRLEGRAPSGGIPLTLTNHNDMSYTTTVSMGTPFQGVEMSPSLSQNFISVATAPFGVSGSSYYNPSMSSSYTPENTIGTVPSISGQSITGTFAGESCMLKGTNSAIFGYNASVVLTNSSVADDLYPLGAKGVLGYGINAPKTSPPNSSLIPTFLTPTFTGTALCGIELNHMDDPVPDGIFTMGAVDPTAFTGDFANVIVPTDSTVSWAVPFDSLSYTSSAMNQSLTGLLASIDLYHSVIQVPTTMASQIYAGISGSQAMESNAWSLPCSSQFTVTLAFGGKPFTITERDTIVKLTNGTCQGVVTGGAQGIAKVGAPFMRNVYTQFGANVSSAGATAFVGFAAKTVRSSPSVVTTTVLGQTTVTAVPTSTSVSGDYRVAVQDTILLSMLAITSIVGLLTL